MSLLYQNLRPRCGGFFANPGQPSDSAALIKAAWDAGVRYFDTAPMYGHGLSEARCGQGLR
ncbi:aldo/keto reductase, partial [Paraburkholderia domus]|uniref:aldo/keto reductase n=1 Tax=Paraburkholderia domus TaxID=2793075 RepID=UPI0039A42947